MPIILLILLSLSGGVAYVSKSALPGDVLYPIKINVDEPIEEALAFGPKALSAVHIAHANERMREIAALSDSGKLDRREAVLAKFALENEVTKVNADIAQLNAKSDFRSAREAEMTLRSDLKKSAALPIIYGDTSSLPDRRKSADVADNAPQPTVNSGDTTSPAPATQSVSTGTGKYVPKLLPQRPNIVRGDDEGGEDD